LLQACLNGGRTKLFHPAVPCTPNELAEDGQAVVAAGAQELHIHPRGPDGLESLDPDDVAAALQAIRARIPDITLGVSTGWWIRPGGPSRKTCIRNWSTLPEYVSVNLVEDDAPEVMALCLERGVGVEAGLWSAKDAERFVGLTQAPNCLRVLIEINEQEEREGIAVAQAILTILDTSGSHIPRLLHGSEATMWSVYREAVRLGLDRRIGLEDGALLPSGDLAADNAALIDAARALTFSG
jgi:uncharacterized protein (DUF849 family)